MKILRRNGGQNIIKILILKLDVFKIKEEILFIMLEMYVSIHLFKKEKRKEKIPSIKKNKNNLK